MTTFVLRVYGPFNPAVNTHDTISQHTDTLSPDTLRGPSPEAVAEPSQAKPAQGTQPRTRGMNLATMRKAAAATIRQFADRTADQISRCFLRAVVA